MIRPTIAEVETRLCDFNIQYEQIKEKRGFRLRIMVWKDDHKKNHCIDKILSITDLPYIQMHKEQIYQDIYEIVLTHPL